MWSFGLAENLIIFDCQRINVEKNTDKSKMRIVMFFLYKEEKGAGGAGLGCSCFLSDNGGQGAFVYLSYPAYAVKYCPLRCYVMV
ncbi:hypothetical protein CEV08_08080 [Bartonella tribocorum]|uniref:Uncharacterized protein n=1 Tax=Bartonella tribocorum TaxID=85701 RepID=A0A2M6UQI6_9HYPH|nr:hypothetical protein CEV08_08080 [Bartonella tribocorum]